MVRDLDGFIENMGIPVLPTAAEPSLAAEDELDRRIKQLECFGPLKSLVCVLLFATLRYLPRTPDFIAQGPVLDLVRLLTTCLSVSDFHHTL